MWLFLSEKKYWIVSLVVLILDGIIVYYMPSYYNKLSYFYPMLTLSLIPFLYRDNSKKYYNHILILGLIYDVFYSDIFLYNTIIFLIIAIFDGKIMQYFKNSLFLLMTLVFFNIILYDSISFILVMITSYQIVTINDLIYKISHSIMINFMSVFVYFFMFKRNIATHKM